MGCGRPPFGPAPGGGDGRRREEASPLLGAKLLRPGGALPARAEPSGCDMASSGATMKSKTTRKCGFAELETRWRGHFYPAWQCNRNTTEYRFLAAFLSRRRLRLLMPTTRDVV